MHPAIIIGTVRSLIVDVAMGQIPRSTERISSSTYKQTITQPTYDLTLSTDIGAVIRQSSVYRMLFRDIY